MALLFDAINPNASFLANPTISAASDKRVEFDQLYRRSIARYLPKINNVSSLEEFTYRSMSVIANRHFLEATRQLRLLQLDCAKNINDQAAVDHFNHQVNHFNRVLSDMLYDYVTSQWIVRTSPYSPDGLD